MLRQRGDEGDIQRERGRYMRERDTHILSEREK
jgi:hypothetical protein